MHTSRVFLTGCVCILFSGLLPAENGVVNGGFEAAAGPNIDGPAYWWIGTPDEPPEYSLTGNWSLDRLLKTEGDQSLRLSPDTDGDYAVSQVLHIPTYDLKNKIVRLSADIRTENLSRSAMILLVAVNPELEPDPDYQTGIAGKTILASSGDDGVFRHYEASFTGTDAAEYILLYCSVSGKTGSAWFDNISVDIDIDPPGPASPPVDPPVKNRNFRMGFVNENPLSISIRGYEEVILKAGESAEVINIFFHARWSQLTGESLEWGHRQQLMQARVAREAGLKIALTFDFTHDHPESVGDVSPAPDGTPVGSLNDAEVAEAYKSELLALCERVHPEYVFVGIETSIFYDRHPDQWPAYVSLFKDIANMLTDRYPGIHVSAYFTLDWLVDAQCRVNAAHAKIWKQLTPELQSVAYSFYPDTWGLGHASLAPGYFAKAAEILPGLPVIFPEFGAPGGPEAQLSFEAQSDLLERIFREIESIPVELICWFSVYDQTYFGVPQDFKTAFRWLGMHTLDGTPKPALAVWKSVFNLSTGMTVEPRPQPAAFRLAPCFPNPFNAGTRIAFELVRSAPVELIITNSRGERIREYDLGVMTPGVHEIFWDGRSDRNGPVPSGTYVVRMMAEGRAGTQKVTVMQ